MKTFADIDKIENEKMKSESEIYRQINFTFKPMTDEDGNRPDS